MNNAIDCFSLPSARAGRLRMNGSVGLFFISDERLACLIFFEGS